MIAIKLSQPKVRQLTYMLLAFLFSAFLTACGPEKIIGYQGRLTDSSGNPINGTVLMTFRLWTCASCTTSADNVFEKTTTVTVVNGLFDYAIGSDVVDAYNRAGLDPAVFAQPL